MGQPASAAPGQRPVCSGFRPSRHGFGFANSWPPGPAIVAGPVGVGNAARGLCGGMVFAALDYWHANREPPAEQPAAGAPLFRFIVRRLIQSWRFPAGVTAYYRGMVSPDGRLSAGTVVRQWPRVRALLDAGQPATIGVVTVSSANPLLLGHNHQVLAYGYAADGPRVSLRVYDPNSGPDDEVVIRFSTATPWTAAFAHNLSVRWPVRGFFLTRYTRAEPPAG